MNRVIKPNLGELLDTRYRQHPRYRGCVGHWMMVESGGATIYDLSGNGITGAFTTAPLWTSGQRGPQLNFLAASTQYVTLAAGSNYDFANTTFSVAVWAKYTAGVLIANGGDVGGWVIDSLESYMKSSIGSTVFDHTFSPAINDGLLHHIVVIFQTSTTVNADNISYHYTDGSFRTTSPGAATTYGAPAGGSMWIGRRAQGSYLTGDVLEARIYNRALTPGEVVSLYQDPFLEFEDSVDIFSETAVDASTNLMAQICL